MGASFREEHPLSNALQHISTDKRVREEKFSPAYVSYMVRQTKMMASAKTHERKVDPCLLRAEPATKSRAHPHFLIMNSYYALSSDKRTIRFTRATFRCLTPNDLRNSSWYVIFNVLTVACSRENIIFSYVRS